MKNEPIKSKLKKAKSQFIILKYRKKNGLEDIRSGIITATTKNHILFLINNIEPEITIELKDIIEIIQDKKEMNKFK